MSRNFLAGCLGQVWIVSCDEKELVGDSTSPETSLVFGCFTREEHTVEIA